MASSRSGGLTKPSTPARGVNGRSTPTAPAAVMLMTRALLGLLRHGIPRVRMIRMTRVCVASDSMNQPVRNNSAPALRPKIRTPKVRKSKIELYEPHPDHITADHCHAPFLRLLQVINIYAVAGNGHLGSIVEQVIEQNLRWQHREEREK